MPLSNIEGPRRASAGILAVRKTLNQVRAASSEPASPYAGWSLAAQLVALEQFVKSLSGAPAQWPKRMGIRGAFAVVKRPDGKLQVTYNRLPVYTYAHEGPKQVLCDNVNGWLVVRL